MSKYLALVMLLLHQQLLRQLGQGLLLLTLQYMRSIMHAEKLCWP